MSKLVAFLKDETRATTIEYGLIIAGTGTLKPPKTAASDIAARQSGARAG